MSDAKEINDWIRKSGVNPGEISDGYHTFDELYEHRVGLFIALCRMMMEHANIYNNSNVLSRIVWRSRKHSDGSAIDGWFVMGVFEAPGFQITYHLPDSEWPNTDFAWTREVAPEFDGHTSKDVLDRLYKIFILGI